MNNKEQFVSFSHYGSHKGFYREDDLSSALFNIHYEDFFEAPDDEDFPYYSAHELLRGSCHHFVLGLQKIFGYTPYIIEGNNNVGFHAFSQIYKNKKWFYIDARGITTSFDDFMEVAREFVSDEYTIRRLDEQEKEELIKDDMYFEEAQAFAVAVIKKYKEYYTL